MGLQPRDGSGGELEQGFQVAFFFGGLGQPRWQGETQGLLAGIGLAKGAQGIADEGRQGLGHGIAGADRRQAGGRRQARQQLADQAQQVGLEVLGQGAGLAGEQARLQQRAAVLQGLGQQPGVAELADVGQSAEQSVHGAAQVLRQFVPAHGLEGVVQAVEGALAALLAGQLLGEFELVQLRGQGQELQHLAALDLGAEEAADGQWPRALDAQLAAGERGVEQVDQNLVDRRLGLALGGQFAGYHLALDQAAHRQQFEVEAAEGPLAPLQGHGQAGIREGGDVQQAALGQGSRAAGFQGGLAAVAQGQLEQQLEALGGFLQGDDFGLGAVPGGQQAVERLQQLERQVRGVLRGAGRGLAGRKGARTADFSHRGVTTCRKSSLRGWGMACIMPPRPGRPHAWSSPV
ncbi:hypothetical protein D3C84_596450 [compost metagenome]